MKDWIWDALAGLGIVLLVGGLGWVYRPLAPIVLGLTLLGAGVYGAKLFSGARRTKDE